jgi:predicted DNA-binding transcriptional regulator AlpA
MTIAITTPQIASDHDARVWTIEAVRGLGATTDVETAGAILGIGRTKAYELAKNGQFPTRVLRIGRRYLVPIPAILALLGVE